MWVCLHQTRSERRALSLFCQKTTCTGVPEPELKCRHSVIPEIDGFFENFCKTFFSVKQQNKRNASRKNKTGNPRPFIQNSPVHMVMIADSGIVRCFHHCSDCHESSAKHSLTLKRYYLLQFLYCFEIFGSLPSTTMAV